MAPEAKLCVAVLGEATVPPTDSCQINLGQIFASYNISHSLLQLIFVLQRFSVVVTTNIWFSHCYNLFALLQGLCVVTILLQRIHVVTILIQHIACNCYNLFDKHCNNGIFWLLQALQTPPGKKVNAGIWSNMRVTKHPSCPRIQQRWLQNKLRAQTCKEDPAWKFWGRSAFKTFGF